ncbi:uncharacterized protein LOC110401433 isoform X2 [Numida meleagris]|uniref:uncharacterized protein LOC110401433 isoform X2 n=1 Tax=Numida meleagris TaxID=8996 RepID=UPI000B3E22CB|nr:uncharacterized protein LOC110401433 isoform X2 [Numida meleagris]
MELGAPTAPAFVLSEQPSVLDASRSGLVLQDICKRLAGPSAELLSWPSHHDAKVQVKTLKEQYHREKCSPSISTLTFSRSAVMNSLR